MEELGKELGKRTPDPRAIRQLLRAMPEGSELEPKMRLGVWRALLGVGVQRSGALRRWDGDGGDTLAFAKECVRVAGGPEDGCDVCAGKVDGMVGEGAFDGWPATPSGTGGQGEQGDVAQADSPCGSCGSAPHWKRRSATMERIIAFYCKTRGVSYFPGLAYMVHTILMVVETGGRSANDADTCHAEDIAYALMYALVTKYAPLLFAEEPLAVQSLFSLFRLLVEYHDPGLCAHLDEHLMRPEVYAQPWLMLLMASSCGEDSGGAGGGGSRASSKGIMANTPHKAIGTPRKGGDVGQSPASGGATPNGKDGGKKTRGGSSRSPAATGSGWRTVARLWDLYFTDADPFLNTFVALSLLTLRRRALMETGSMDGLRRALRDGGAVRFGGATVAAVVARAKLFQRATPRSFRKQLNTVSFRRGELDPAFYSSVHIAFCMSVSGEEVCEAVLAGAVGGGSSASSSSVSSATGAATGKEASPPLRFIVFDARPREQFDAGRLAVATHVDPDVVLDSQVMREFVESLRGFLGNGDRQQKSSDRAAGSSGSSIRGNGAASDAMSTHPSLEMEPHLVFIGTGDDAADAFMRKLVLDCVERWYPHVSVVLGGYSGIHAHLAAAGALGTAMADHDESLCLECTPLDQRPVPKVSRSQRIKDALLAKKAQVQGKIQEVRENRARKRAASDAAKGADDAASVCETVDLNRPIRKHTLVDVSRLGGDTALGVSGVSGVSGGGGSSSNGQQTDAATSACVPVSLFPVRKLHRDSTCDMRYIAVSARYFTVLEAHRTQLGMGYVKSHRPLHRVARVSFKRSNPHALYFQFKPKGNRASAAPNAPPRPMVVECYISDTPDKLCTAVKAAMERLKEEEEDGRTRTESVFNDATAMSDTEPPLGSPRGATLSPGPVPSPIRSPHAHGDISLVSLASPGGEGVDGDNVENGETIGEIGDLADLLGGKITGEDLEAGGAIGGGESLSGEPRGDPPAEPNTVVGSMGYHKGASLMDPQVESLIETQVEPAPVVESPVETQVEPEPAVESLIETQVDPAVEPPAGESLIEVQVESPAGAEPEATAASTDLLQQADALAGLSLVDDDDDDVASVQAPTTPKGQSTPAAAVVDLLGDFASTPTTETTGSPAAQGNGSVSSPAPPTADLLDLL